MRIFRLSNATSSPRLKTLIAGFLVAAITTAAITLTGSNGPSWWSKAPVAAAGIDASRSLITLENDKNTKSSLVVIRANLAKKVTDVRILPEYFDTLAVSGSHAFLAKRGIARSQCLNLVSGKLEEELRLPADLKIVGASAMNDDSFLIWGGDSGRRTLIFKTNCTSVYSVTTSQERLNLICPTGNRLVAIDFQGVIFRTTNGFRFEKTRQKYPHLDSLTCGDAGIAGHLSSGSQDFIVSIGPRAARPNLLSNGKGLFALLFDKYGSEWFGLKHGATTTTVGIFPIKG